MKKIENLKREFDVPDATFEGLKAYKGWKTGRYVAEEEFVSALAEFKEAPVDGKRREAKG